MTDFGAEGQKLDGFLDAGQRDVEGLGFFGLAEEVVQAELQEVKLVQAGSELCPLIGEMLVVQGAAEMLGVAGERRGGEAVEGRQGPQGGAVDQGAVDLGEGGVVADGTEARPQAGAGGIFVGHVGHSLGGL